MKNKLLACSLLVASVSVSAEVVEQVRGSIVNKAEESANNFANSLVNGFGQGNTEVSIRNIEHGSPDWSLITIQPIGDLSDEGVNFWQGSIGSYDQNDDRRTTVNLGLGKRWLIDKKSAIVGLNGFVDYEFDSEHVRASIGAEYMRSAFDLHANYYSALSGTKLVGGVEEDALDGYDLIAKGVAPYLPWAKVVLKKYEWERSSLADVDGESYGFEIALMPSLKLEYGWQDDNFMDKSEYGKLTLIYPPKNSGKTLIDGFVDTVAWRSNVDMTEKLLDKVERSNKIVVEFGGVTISRED
jgi:hypothetical protein